MNILLGLWVRHRQRKHPVISLTNFFRLVSRVLNRSESSLLTLALKPVAAVAPPYSVKPVELVLARSRRETSYGTSFTNFEIRFADLGFR